MKGRTRRLALAQAAIVTFGLLLLVQGLNHKSGEALPTRLPKRSPEAADRRTETLGPADSTALPGAQEQSALPGPYPARLVKEESDYELWQLDPQGLNWLLANQRLVLTQELETKPEPTGGLRILDFRGLSTAVLKGLKPGDVLIDINGKELDTAFDVEDLLEDPAYQAAKGWRVRILRDDNVVTLDYRAN
jgi:hypothetical protein